MPAPSTHGHPHRPHVDAAAGAGVGWQRNEQCHRRVSARLPASRCAPRPARRRRRRLSVALGNPRRRQHCDPVGGGAGGLPGSHGDRGGGARADACRAVRGALRHREGVWRLRGDGRLPGRGHRVRRHHHRPAQGAHPAGHRRRQARAVREAAGRQRRRRARHVRRGGRAEGDAAGCDVDPVLSGGRARPRADRGGRHRAGGAGAVRLLRSDLRYPGGAAGVRRRRQADRGCRSRPQRTRGGSRIWSRPDRRPHLPVEP